METYLTINLARDSGHPDNNAVSILLHLRRCGFIIQTARTQRHLPLTEDSPAHVLIVQVIPPPNYRRLLPRMVRDTKCGHVVLLRTQPENPASRLWIITREGMAAINRSA